MRVLAIDPGISTGMAYADDKGKLIEGHVAKSPSEVFERIRELKNTDYVIVVEDFVGAGPRTKEAIFVLKLVGGVTAACFLEGLPCVLQVPQQRIPLLKEAHYLLAKGTIIHIIDAYSHVLAYLESVTDVIFDTASE